MAITKASPGRGISERDIEERDRKIQQSEDQREDQRDMEKMIRNREKERS